MDPTPDDPKAPLWVGPDLFPRSFMVSLPASSKHIGPTVLFGGQNHDGIPIVREITDVQQSLDPDRDWMPAKHFKIISHSITVAGLFPHRFVRPL